jgi:D-alanine-D-alanine ligase-like ATP-grasp enzyme
MKANQISPLGILKEFCEKTGYTYKELNQRLRTSIVSGKGKSFIAEPNWMYPINNNSSTELARNKAATNELLGKEGYNLPRGDFFFTYEPENKRIRAKGKGIEEAKKYSEKIGYPVFVKPNKGTCGISARIDENNQSLEDHFKEISNFDHIAIVQEIISLPEYRIFVLNGKPKFAYSKSSASITGDGSSSVKNLLEKFNKKIHHERNHIKINSQFLKEQLEKNNLDLESRLEKGSSLSVSPRANLSAGSSIIDYTEEISKETEEWVRDLTNIMGLRIAGIDVFVEDSIQDPSNFKIIEINGNPGLTGIYKIGKKQKVLEIWKEITKSYFQS